MVGVPDDTDSMNAVDARDLTFGQIKSMNVSFNDELLMEIIVPERSTAGKPVASRLLLRFSGLKNMDIKLSPNPWLEIQGFVTQRALAESDQLTCFRLDTDCGYAEITAKAFSIETLEEIPRQNCD